MVSRILKPMKIGHGAINKQCIPPVTRVLLCISLRDGTDVRSSQTTQSSSQKFDDEVWEEEAMQLINQQGSQGSSQYDDPELVSLIETMQM